MDRFSSRVFEMKAAELAMFAPQDRGAITIRQVCLDYAFQVASGHMHLRLDQPATTEKRLTFFAQILGSRSTTKPSDEAVCLATLIGLDPQTIMDVEADHQVRMKALFTSIERVPISLLFGRTSRLQEDGYRWIPTTLLWKSGWGYSPPNAVQEYGFADARGIHFSRMGFKLTISSDANAVHPIVMDFRLPNTPPWAPGMVAVFDTDSNTKWTDCVGKSVGILPLMPWDGTQNYVVPATLVTLKEPSNDYESKDTLYGRYEDQVSLGPETRKGLNERHVSSQCEVLPQTQSWCIG
jgi:hypothetical protein